MTPVTIKMLQDATQDLTDETVILDNKVCDKFKIIGQLVNFETRGKPTSFKMQ